VERVYNSRTRLNAAFELLRVWHIVYLIGWHLYENGLIGFCCGLGAASLLDYKLSCMHFGDDER
jgi:hypothetical protein